MPAKDNAEPSSSKYVSDNSIFCHRNRLTSDLKRLHRHPETLNVTAALAIVPVDKTSDNGSDYRVFAGQRRIEIGAGWSQVEKSSGKTYVNLKIAAPEFSDR